MSKPIIAVLDFDGTITRKDTLIEFIRFARGNFSFLIGFAIFSPLLVLMKLHLYPNWKAKEKVFTFFFRGMHIESFNHLCENFFLQCGESLIFNEAKECVFNHKQVEHEVVILTASLENWVKPFARYLGVDTLIATVPEIQNNILTGRLLTKNCYGKEKVIRLKEQYPNYADCHIIAYGDSRGDKELLKFANESHYQIFNQ